MRVGLVYDRFGDTPRPAGAPDDWDAEYEPEATVAALEDALHRLGHTPVRVGSTAHLLAAMARGPITAPPLALAAALSIAEGLGIGEGGTRNREAHAAVLLELAGVPALFSDALALSVSLDKHLTKTIVQAAGVPTPPWAVLRPGEPGDLAAAEALGFPLFVKPRYEGTARGIAPTSRVETPAALRAEAARQHAIYRQDLLAEAFVEGGEATVGVVGTGEGARALPVLLRATEAETGIGLHALAERPETPLAYRVAPVLMSETETLAAAMAVGAHRALGLADVSRSDVRIDRTGGVWFLEVNALPTFAPDGTFAVLAELDGVPYGEWLAGVLGRGLTRIAG
ncbi:MAG TPA: D-alanine--D-alanine ligase [Rubricoccaceae bacterium]